MKQLVLTFAAVSMAFSYAAFAGDNKANKEAKTSTETTVEAPAEAKATTANLHWYTVSYATNPNGVIQSSSAYYDEGPKEAILSPCEDGDERDCLRGFVSPLTSFPNPSAGDETIKRPD